MSVAGVVDDGPGLGDKDGRHLDRLCEELTPLPGLIFNNLVI